MDQLKTQTLEERISNLNVIFSAAETIQSNTKLKDLRNYFTHLLKVYYLNTSKIDEEKPADNIVLVSYDSSRADDHCYGRIRIYIKPGDNTKISVNAMDFDRQIAILGRHSLDMQKVQASFSFSRADNNSITLIAPYGDKIVTYNIDLRT